MRRQEYANASILHFDVRRQIRRRTNASLRELGFQRIASVDNGDDLAKFVRARQFDLMVVAADAAESDAVELVRRSRQYDASSDPYAPMILATWNGAADRVHEALNSGTDQLLMWPFSTEQLGSRVDALINARKPFVETEDYLGPDRRGSKGRGPRSNAVEVPNALRAKIQGRPDLAPSSAAIHAARVSLQRIKVRNVARRIGMTAKKLCQRCDDAAFLQTRAESDLAAILHSLSVIRSALQIAELDHLQLFCDSIEAVADQLAQAVPRLDPKGLALLEQSAMALRVAMDVDEDMVSTPFEMPVDVDGQHLDSPSSCTASGKFL